MSMACSRHQSKLINDVTLLQILRSHVMVRVGGGWDTLAHYLDKHDPCRCKAQHRTSLSARLARPKHDLVGATVTYERPDPGPTSLPYSKEKNDRYEPTSLQYHEERHYTSTNRLNEPTSLPYLETERSHSPSRKLLAPRSISPGRKSSSPDRRTKIVPSNHLVPTPLGLRNKSPRPVSPAPAAESASDNGSEVSDEGYRSLGVVAGSTQGSPSTKALNRYSLHSQNSIEDAEFNGELFLYYPQFCNGTHPFPFLRLFQEIQYIDICIYVHNCSPIYLYIHSNNGKTVMV